MTPPAEMVRGEVLRLRNLCEGLAELQIQLGNDPLPPLPSDDAWAHRDQWDGPDTLVRRSERGRVRRLEVTSD